MGPETTAHLTIRACPPEQVRAVVGILDEFDIVQGADVVRGQITLGATYYAHERDFTTLTLITARMLTAAPRATWTAYAPPAESDPGVYLIHDPLIGVWRTGCDVEGEASVPLAEVTAGRARGDRVLDVVLGRAWMEIVDELTRTSAGDVVTAVPAGHQVIWEDGVVTIEGGGEDGEDVVLTRASVTVDYPFTDVDAVVAQHLAPVLSAANFLVIPGTWVYRDRDGNVEGEVLARALARRSASGSPAVGGQAPDDPGAGHGTHD
jgi:hypothetical protein